MVSHFTALVAIFAAFAAFLSSAIARQAEPHRNPVTLDRACDPSGHRLLPYSGVRVEAVVSGGPSIKTRLVVCDSGTVVDDTVFSAPQSASLADAGIAAAVPWAAPLCLADGSCFSLARKAAYTAGLFPYIPHTLVGGLFELGTSSEAQNCSESTEALGNSSDPKFRAPLVVDSVLNQWVELSLGPQAGRPVLSVHIPLLYTPAATDRHFASGPKLEGNLRWNERYSSLGVIPESVVRVAEAVRTVGAESVYRLVSEPRMLLQVSKLAHNVADVISSGISAF